MKISYKTHPILKILENGDFSLLRFMPDADFFLIDTVKSLLREYLPHFKKSLNYVSNPFQEASIIASSKLLAFFNDIVQSDDDPFNISGVFCTEKSVNMIFVGYDYDNGEKFHVKILLSFTPAGTLCNLYCASTLSPDHIVGYNHPDIVRQQKLHTVNDQLDTLLSLLATCATFYLFKEYAEVETKLLPPGKIIRDISCNYLNDTKMRITYLDSKWFTTLVKSDGFKVRGFFRLQPKKKDGEWTKELIWINDFMKTGYTAPARKLSN